MSLTISFLNPGTYAIEDDGIRGNNTSVIRDGTGSVASPSFIHPTR